MANFTPGKWWIAPPLFDGDVIYAPAQTEDRRNEVVAMGITNRADARLIAAAPEMYELLLEYYRSYPYFSGINFRAKRILHRIDGKEDN